MRQAVADVRRARDAVAAIPLVDQQNISLQGTSLGGFVAATTAGLDDGYDRVFVMLAGGNLHDLIEHGQKDAAKLRAELKAAGLTGEKLRTLLDTVEPIRLAHRIEASRTWLYSGSFDDVVPMKNALALAAAVGLDDQHHCRLAADHYSGMLFMPFILTHMRRQISQPLPASSP
jgi:cephalosporin-C deacetylase-like acetyl esterase